jgi:hypothetical protein
MGHPSETDLTRLLSTLKAQGLPLVGLDPAEKSGDRPGPLVTYHPCGAATVRAQWAERPCLGHLSRLNQALCPTPTSAHDAVRAAAAERGPDLLAWLVGDLAARDPGLLGRLAASPNGVLSGMTPIPTEVAVAEEARSRAKAQAELATPDPDPAAAAAAIQKHSEGLAPRATK